MLKSKESVYINNIELAEVLTDKNDYLNDYFIVNNVSGRGILAEENEVIPVTGMNGAHAASSRTPVRYLDVTITAKGKDENSLHKKLERLDELIPRGKDLSIVFADEKDRIYHGRLDAVQGEFLSSVLYQATLSFICSDPFKYGEEKTVEFSEDSVVIENNGTATAKPIFELTAKEKATFAMIANGNDEYNLIGQPADDDVQVIDERTSVLYENGSTIDTWQHTTDRRFISNDINIDGLDGRMGTDGAGIRVETRATPTDKQNGPAIVKELPSAIQDFEIESTFDIISLREIENWRMMIYFLDENLNNIGHIGVKDNSRLYKRRVALSQLGEHNKGVSLIGDSDYIENNARDATLFYLRFKREGKKFSAYVAHWRNQKHDTVWQASYNDRNNRFQGRLKYITLFIGRYQDRVTPNRLRINSVEVFELSQVEEDQTPYIIYPGDVVTFDHANNDILINGESRKDLKAFGGSFFTLKKGIDTLTVTPENTFNTKITYRERYK